MLLIITAKCSVETNNQPLKQTLEKTARQLLSSFHKHNSKRRFEHFYSQLFLFKTFQKRGEKQRKHLA